MPVVLNSLSGIVGWGLSPRSGNVELSSMLKQRKIVDLVFLLLVWSYYVQMMGYREIIVTKPYLVSKEAQLYSL